jgi:Fe-S cluster biosynthesis and repair protein YggX
LYKETTLSDARIEQFRQMAEADPDNELGHFSLGRAYLDAGMPGQAIGAFKRALELNPNLGRAYHLLGQAQIQEGQKAEAIQTLTEGAKVSAARGEVLARTEIAKLLEELGAPLPAEATTVKVLPIGEGDVLCSRCGQVGPRLPKPPFKNKQGELIYSKICANCWKEWVGMGTKVINELRLPMNEPEAQRTFDKHMYEFLNLQ